MKSVDAIYPFVGSANEGDEVKRKRRGGRRRVLRISAVVPPLCCKSDHHLLVQVMLNFLKDFEAMLGIKISCSQETESLGTADDFGEPFVLISDVIDEYPIDEYPMEVMIAFHKSHGGEASIMVTKVKLH
ncbi:hypothetical protein L6452_18920 [Arctium lappa]|uniref:Uncharacterized protein n=1 Tax=Arctium lappa TaxID=4217 RepID=A0ACB9B810_ARCLA|nr:hypothetical protein L6452_18920 [Arctium lappa]